MRHLSALLSLVGYGLATFTGSRLSSGSGVEEPEPVALPTVEVARVATVGFWTLAADLYFLRAVQYFGNPANDRVQYRYLAPLVELLTDLDPEFREPLAWGAIAVQKNLGHETWVNIAESTRLLKKGTRRFPDDYRFHVYLAYNLMTFHHDYVGAAEELKRALPLPGRPAYVGPLISRLYSTAGDLDTAEAFAEALVEETHDPSVKEVMQERVLDVETERMLQGLDLAGNAFQQRFGRRPGSALELLTSGFISAIPVDPRGGELTVDADGTFRSSKLLKRLKLFDPRRRKPPPPAR